jgi:hypothetical protein
MDCLPLTPRRLLKHFCTLALTFWVAAALAQTSGHPAAQRIELGASGQRYPFVIYSNRPWSGDMRQVESAVFVFHGVARNGDAYYDAAHQLLAASGPANGATLLIAPNFFSRADAQRFPVAGLPLWEGERGWNGGWDAANWSRPLSAFEPIDDLLAALLDHHRFPALQSIVVAGHSGGGQIVHRYAVLNRMDERVRAAGKSLRYVIANPSSYMYFSPERPAPDGGFAAPDAATCPGYDIYRYGVSGLVRYAQGASGPSLFGRYAGRDVVYLLGTADNDPNHRVLDRSCMARTQGAHRLERGRHYIRYEQRQAGNTVPLNRQAWEVIGVGHDQARMFGSRCGARLLLALPEDRNPGGANCRPGSP